MSHHRLLLPVNVGRQKAAVFCHLYNWYDIGLLGILRLNFKDVSCECFLNLYKTMVRPLLEYANSIWSPWRLCNLTKIEQERPAVADKPARRLRNVCTVYVRAVGL